MLARRLNIFTCADQAYEDFAPLFVASCLWSNPQASVEVGLENVESFRLAHGRAMQIVADCVPDDSVLVRAVPFSDSQGRRFRPNSVRFLVPPAAASEYVYISDIDIVTLQPEILQRHLRHMAKTQLPYSNRIREGTESLTGLHFTRFEAMYPLADHTDLDPQMNDEALLYRLVERKLGSVAIAGPPYRPVHGIHISPNRQPVRSEGEPLGWGIKNYHDAWIDFRNSALFRAMEPFLSDRVRSVAGQIDSVIQQQGSRPRVDKPTQAQADKKVLPYVRRYAKLLKRMPDVALDTVFVVGAGREGSTAGLRHLAPEAAAIYAFEPSASGINRLTEALAKDHKAQMFPLALVHDLPSSVEWQLLARFGRDRLVAGDSFCLANGIERIGILRIDTESYDSDVLSGFKAMLQQQRIDVIELVARVSADDARHETLDALRALLEPQGYAVANVWDQAFRRGTPQLETIVVVFCRMPPPVAAGPASQHDDV